jgi:hypothetical protein
VVEIKKSGLYCHPNYCGNRVLINISGERRRRRGHLKRKRNFLKKDFKNACEIKKKRS